MSKTDENYELSKDRIPVYLDEHDIDFLLKEWRRGNKDRSDREKSVWGNIAFRLNTALFQNDKKID